MKKYIEPTIEEGQRLRVLWGKCTSKPMTSREIAFARLVAEAEREECREAWKEAAIGWTVCASVHEQWAKGKDALYTTRHGDFDRHAEEARQRHSLLTPNV